MFVLAAASPAAAQTRGLYSIDSFVTSLVVNTDGSLIVREDITFEFRGAHQGIFRRSRCATRGTGSSSHFT